MAKKVTLESLDKNLGNLTKDVNNLTKTVGGLTKTVDDLAGVVKREFDVMDEKMTGGFNEVKKKLEGIVYRFEYNEVLNRLEAIEQKLGLRK